MFLQEHFVSFVRSLPALAISFTAGDKTRQPDAKLALCSCRNISGDPQVALATRFLGGHGANGLPMASEVPNRVFLQEHFSIHVRDGVQVVRLTVKEFLQEHRTRFAHKFTDCTADLHCF